MKQDIVGTLERGHIESLLEKGKRIDGRGLLERRPLDIRINVIKKAEGSALVRLGDTKVITGVKLQAGAPYPDMPDEGVFILSAEMPPLASPTFESGPPSEDAIELSRVADRGIRESKMIDTKKLCIKEGEQVWIVFADAYILDDYGNLFDAVSIATVSALISTQIPRTVINEETGAIETLEETFDMPLTHLVGSHTFAKVGNNIVYDPSLSEERVADARFTVSIRDDGFVSAMQKGGSGVFTYDEIETIIDIAKEKNHELIE